MTRATDGRKSEERRFVAVQRQEIKAAQVKTERSKLAAAERGDMVLDLLRRDGGTQSRAALDGETIAAYAETYVDNADKMPPITVFFDGSTYWLADGFHRVEAALKAGLVALPMELHQGTSRDAILYSVGANATHGLRRTNADKRRAVMRLLNDDEWSKWSDHEIARQCHVSQPFVSKTRASLITVISQAAPTRTFISSNGTVSSMNTANIGKRQNGKIPGAFVPTGSPPTVIRPALPDDTLPQLVDAVAAGSLGVSQAIQLNSKLKSLADDVQMVALTYSIFDTVKLDVLNRLYKSRGNDGSNATFDEIAVNAGFHYGKELEQWLDFKTANILQIEKALKSIADVHRELAQDENRQAQVDRAESVVPADENYGILAGDMRLLDDAIADNSLDLIFTDPLYAEEYLPLWLRLSELAARKLKPGALLLAYSGQAFLPQVMTHLGSHLTYWWMFAVHHTDAALAIWNKQIQVRWKPVLVYCKPYADGRIPAAPEHVVDHIDGGGRKKDYHAYGQDASEATYWIEKLTAPGALICDPFVGGGSIPVACKLTGRRWIGTELNVEQAKIARLRVMEAQP